MVTLLTKETTNVCRSACKEPVVFIRFEQSLNLLDKFQ